MQISHVMRRDVVTITADQTLQNAAATTLAEFQGAI
jgi:hypothetical protein